MSTSLSLATVFAIFTAGVYTSSSALAIPALQATNAPNTISPQFTAMFNRGKNLTVLLSALSIGSFGYHAFTTRSAGGDWKASAIGAALASMFAPWTLTIMASTNEALLGARGTDAEQMAHLGNWYYLNLIRAIFPLAAGVVGIQQLSA
jgi:hypothetical protein